jgi:hypothetical protein
MKRRIALILSSEHESPRAEAAEKARDKAKP